MSGSYKIAIIAAIVLCCGIITYHLIQEKDPGITRITVTPEPAHPKKVGTKSPPPTSAPDQPGIGDLMTRLRNHIETVEPLTPTPNEAPANNRNEISSPDDITTDSPEHEPQTPTLTFGPTPDVVAISDTNDSALNPNPNDTPQQLAEQNNSPVNNTHTTEPQKDYIIQAGDTFSSIAVKIYGSPKHWIDIAMANPFLDPQKLQVGQSVRLPDINEVQLKVKTVIDQPSTKKARTHIVRPGESLYSIADHYYNNADLWRVIFDANRTTLGSDPDRLEAGEIIKIPPNPEAEP